MISRIARGLKFGPSNLNEVAFYSSRLKKEKSIRSLGLIFMALTLVVQMAAAAIPAQNSYAASNNDLIYGGVSSKSDLVNKCRSNSQGIQDIFGKFGVSCDHIASGTTNEVNIVSGRYDYWSAGRSDSPSSQDVRMTAGSQTFYHRPLSVWGNGVSYTAYNVKANGKNYYILKNCGNITTVGPFQPPAQPAPPQPKLEVFKKLLTSPNVKPGDTVQFRIAYRNPVPDSVAKDFRLRDLLNPNFKFVSMDGQNATVEGDPAINLDGLGYSSGHKATTLMAIVESTARHGQELCNVARVSADVVDRVDSNQVCVTVVNPPPPETPPTPPPTPPQETPKCPIPGKENLPKDSPDCKEEPPEPQGVCVATSSFLDDSSNSFKVTTTSTVSGGTKVVKYVYVLNGDVGTTRESATGSLTDMQTYENLSPGDYEVKVSVQFTNDSKKTISRDCVARITISEEPEIAISKIVTRDSQNVDGKKVSSGDILVFTLRTENITGTPYTNYEGEDNFGDVLDYATIVDESELAEQGMTLGEDNYLRWKVDKIAGNGEDVKTVTVKVKEVVPSTNRPSTNSGDYDCVITNRYGNQVTLNVDCPLVKVVERTSKNLPNTGPGTTAVMAFGFTSVAGYFFARARILVKEYDIIGRLQTGIGAGL